MFMLILIDDDYHIYISQLNNKTPFFPSLNIEKSKMADTDKQKSGFLYILSLIGNTKTQNQCHLLCLIHQNGHDIIFR